jgi:hypothetical protein
MMILDYNLDYLNIHYINHADRSSSPKDKSVSNVQTVLDNHNVPKPSIASKKVSKKKCCPFSKSKHYTKLVQYFRHPHLQ